MIALAFKYIKQHKFLFSFYVLLEISSTTLGIISPLIGANIIDSLINKIEFTFIYYCILLLIINISNVIIGYISTILYVKVQSYASFSFNKDLIDHIHTLPFTYAKNQDPVYLSQRINSDCNNIIIFALSSVVSIIINTITLLFVCIIVFQISKMVAVVLLILVVTYICIYKIMGTSLYDKNLNQTEASNHYFSTLNDQIAYLEFIKTHSANHYFRRRLNASFQSLLMKVLSFQKTSYIFSGLDQIFSIMATVGIYILGGFLFFKNHISIGQVTILNTYFNLLLNVARFFFTFSKQRKETQVYYDRIQEILNQSPEKKGFIQIEDIKSITLRNITFYFENRCIINNFNQTFLPNNIYVLTGKNGVGKTTLFKILAGLYLDKYEGSVLYNHNNINHLDLYFLRKKTICFAEQNPVILDDSLEENTSLFKNDHVSQLSYLNISHSLLPVSKNKEKFNMLNLSVGEKQRIAFIRAINQDATVYLFDEPTAALDNEAVNILTSYIENIKHKKIILIVSHDSRIINIADKIIHL